MNKSFGAGRVELVQGDIVEQDVDAIVNAANTRMLGGGGVDGAIHRAAGSVLLDECRRVKPDARGRRCLTGQVRVTGAGHLQAKHVIHGVGPIYDDMNAEDAASLLQSVHENALQAAAKHDCKSVAFPAISTGVYGYPVADAAEVALATVARFLSEEQTCVELVRFVLFSEGDLRTFEAALDELA